jgi:putative heme transporter
MTRPQEPATPPLGTATPQRLSIEIAPRTILLLLLLLLGLWILSRLLPVILVLVAALVLVGTISPGVRWLEKRGLHRGLGIALVFTGLLGVALGFLTLTIPAFIDQAKTLLVQEPALHSSLVKWLQASSLTRPMAVLLRKVELGDLVRMAAASAFDYSARIFLVLAYFISSIFLALYIMIDRDRMRGGLFLLIPRCHHIRLSRILLNLETIVGGYLRGQVITSVCMAVFTFFLLLACGVPNALAIGVFAGVADVLPYLGAILSVGAAAAAAYSAGPIPLMIVTVLMLLYEEFESRFILPKVYGRELRLPSPVILLSLLTGGVLMGITGALLALPLAAAGLMLIEELRVELPGQQAKTEDVELMERDHLNEEEYVRRAEGMSAEMASQIALEISVDRQKEENTMPMKPDTPNPGGKAEPGI